MGELYDKTIDRENKKVKTEKGEEFGYEKLILATGSSPVVPKIKGIELRNVYTVQKEFDYLKKVIDSIKTSTNIVVVGGGFIGVEFCDEISGLKGKNVYLVEMQKDIIANSLDKEFSQIAREKLEAKGIQIMSGVKVEEMSGTSIASTVGSDAV